MRSATGYACLDYQRVLVTADYIELHASANVQASKSWRACTSTSASASVFQMQVSAVRGTSPPPLHSHCYTRVCCPEYRQTLVLAPMMSHDDVCAEGLRKLCAALPPKLDLLDLDFSFNDALTEDPASTS
eukprot:3170091-Amphidinium_carterae.1